MRFSITTTLNDGQTVTVEETTDTLANYVWGLTRYVVEGTYASFTVTRIEEESN